MKVAAYLFLDPSNRGVKRGRLVAGGIGRILEDCDPEGYPCIYIQFINIEIRIWMLVNQSINSSKKGKSLFCTACLCVHTLIIPTDTVDTHTPFTLYGVHF